MKPCILTLKNKDLDIWLDEAKKVLTQAKDQDGNPFKIVLMPVPKIKTTTVSKGDLTFDHMFELEYSDGKGFSSDDTIRVVYASSYLNFLITNHFIIMPKYEDKSKDLLARNNLENLFPNRKVVMIDVASLNLGGGGLHCISQHEPI